MVKGIVVLSFVILSLVTVGFSSQSAFAGSSLPSWTIVDNDTGGDCEGDFSEFGPIPGGSWDPDTKTCTLTEDLPPNPGIFIVDDDITLDGNGHSTQAEFLCEEYGVQASGVSGIDIINLEVFDFYVGISLYGVTESDVLNNNAHNNCFDGILLSGTISGSDFNTVNNNQANANGNDGIHLAADSDENTVNGNTANGNGNNGIELEASSDGNEVNENTTNDNCTGIRLQDSDSNNVNDNSVSNNGGCFETGIHLINSDDNTISGNTVNNNQGDGILLDSSNENMVEDNTAEGNGDEGIELSSSSDNQVTGNTANNNGDDGIELGDSDANTIIGNTANNNDDDGFDVGSDADNNTFEDNIANGNGDEGFDIDGNFGNTYEGNTANNNDEDGFDIEEATDSTFNNNIVQNNGEDGFDIAQVMDSTFNNNIVQNNGEDGYNIDGSSSNTFEDNTVTGNVNDGFQLLFSNGNDFFCNIVSNNGRDGFNLEDSDGNAFDGNTLETNTENGMDLDDSSEGNNIENNNFISNGGAQILNDNGNNHIEGNYFDSYDQFGEGCKDNDVNGVCDSGTFNAFPDASDVITGNGEIGDNNPVTKRNLCDEPEPAMGGCSNIGAIFSNEANIGVTTPGSNELDVIGTDLPIDPTIGNLRGIAGDSGTIFVTGGFEEEEGFVAQINPNTGEIIDGTFFNTFIETEGPGSITIDDLAIEPGTNVLYGIAPFSSSKEDLYTIDPTTGEVTSVGELFPGFDGGYIPVGIGFRSDGVLFAVVDIGVEDVNLVMLELAPGEEGFEVMGTMDMEDSSSLNGFAVCSDGTFIYTRGIAASSEVGIIDPVTGNLIPTSETDETLGDIIFVVQQQVAAGGGEGYEGPTLGEFDDGRLIVSDGFCFDQFCLDVIDYFNHLPIRQVDSGSTHTISMTAYCSSGSNRCNYASVGAAPPGTNINSVDWNVILKRTGNSNDWQVTKVDPNGMLGDVTGTVQIVDASRIQYTFNIEFITPASIGTVDGNAEPPEDNMILVTEIRDSNGGVGRNIFNEGVFVNDIYAYPQVEASYLPSVKVTPLCLNEDPTDRNTCAFELVRQWTIKQAEEKLKEIYEQNNYKTD